MHHQICHVNSDKLKGGGGNEIQLGYIHPEF